MRFASLFITLSVLFAPLAHAACLYGEAFWDKQDYKRAEDYYKECAKNNDSVALYKLGLIYKNGYIENKKDVVKCLAFLRFSAENGYAPAQRELGVALLELNQSDVGRKTVAEYQGNIQATSGNSKILGNTKKTDISPYAWILLAAEKAENKWYYPSGAFSDDDAVQIIQQSRMDRNTKKTATAEAGSWKMKKLRSTAKEILSADEYRAFETAVFSQQADPATRASAMGYLKQKIETERNE